MPPRKAKANVETSPENYPPPSTRLDIGTPEHEPTKQAAASGITQAQKQALIDNLQQEITDRARKLRGQYALQAQGLRVRLEGRLNRVPFQLRQRKMQDLINEYAEKRSPAKPALMSSQASKAVEVPVQRKELKRQSDQISTASDDKENDTDHDLANPKKRAKPTTTTTTTNSKSAAAAPSNAARKAILSPRSHNSRTLPRSPFKHPEPNNKSATHLPLPLSPAKPPLPTSKTTSTRTATRPQQQQRNMTRSDTDSGSRSSGASNTSASTTIVSKKKSAAASARGKAGTATKKAIASATSAMKSAAAGGRKAAAVGKKENVVPAVAGGRSLRKRA